MNRDKKIRELTSQLRILEKHLVKGGKYLLKDFAKFCKTERELEIQQSYRENELR